MNTTQFHIGDLTPRYPIIQGGMGIGISLSNLAGNVAKQGGIGIISAAQIGFREDSFLSNPLKANLTALESEIKKARAISPDGILGVNLMVAMKHYEEYVKKSVACGIDLIISGAGLPLDLPRFTKGSTVKLVPIVSSAKAARVICRMWDKKNNYAPDAIVVEGPLAGGHLGFSTSDLEKKPSVLQIVKEVKEVVKEYAAQYNKSIPVIVAGGIYTAKDILFALEQGADAVQMGTRFVTTHECDAHTHFKESYIHATKEDINIVKSPVGMPGRAILNSFIKNTPGNHTCNYRCLHKCKIKDIPYCISEALIQAANGNTESALLFCGSNAYKATKLEYVKDIFTEYEQALLG